MYVPKDRMEEYLCTKNANYVPKGSTIAENLDFQATKPR